MSRGGWLMLIGGVVLLVGIALFAFGSASFLASLDPTFTTLSPGAFQNLTLEVSESGSLLTYVVGIQDFTEGDEVTAILLLPSGQEAQRATLDTGGPLTANFVARDTGTYTVVIQNTATLTVEVFHTASAINVTEQNLLTAGILTGVVGFITLIGGLIVWIMQRGRQRRQQTLEMPPPP
ncbi:MAG: hypothetical protein V3W28_04100 [Thermoplasmata archaeon]